MWTRALTVSRLYQKAFKQSSSFLGLAIHRRRETLLKIVSITNLTRMQRREVLAVRLMWREPLELQYFFILGIYMLVLYDKHLVTGIRFTCTT